MPAPVNGSSPPAGPPGVEDEPPTAEVVLVSWLVEVAPEVELAPEVLVAPAVVVVVGIGPQPVTQKTLCLTSAPWEPWAWIVSLTWTPWLGWGRHGHVLAS